MGSTLSTVSAGRKYNLSVSVLQAQAALTHSDVLGHEVHGQSKTTAAGRRKLVQGEILLDAVSQEKQSQRKGSSRRNIHGCLGCGSSLLRFVCDRSADGTRLNIQKYSLEKHRYCNISDCLVTLLC